MKNITLTTLMFFSLQMFAQNFVTTTIWKAETRGGGTFIGVSQDLFDAENAITQIDFENQGTKYEIVSSDILESKINIFDEVSVFEDFKSDHKDLEYKHITEIEMIALEYIEDDNFDMGIRFYKSASSVKNLDIIKKRLAELYKNYSKYIFNVDESAILVGFSE